MRYARWDGPGRPFTVVDGVTAAEPGPGEVLVRIDLATVCGSDLHTAGGRRTAPAPSVLGHEQVGTVLATGGEVRCQDGSPVVPGLRAVWSVTASCGDCDRCARGLTQKCRSLFKYGHQGLDELAPLTGGFATHCVLRPGTAIVAVPDTLPDEVAAPAACATATVAAVIAEAGPLDGRRVLVAGAGMLGVTAIAMAVEAGAQVIAVDPDPRRRRQARQFGACEAHERTTATDIDVALELSGHPDAVRTCLDALTIGGTAVLAGSVFPGPSVPLDPERLVRGLHRITGVHNYRPDDLRRAVDFLAAHHTTYPFAELVEGDYDLGALDAAFEGAQGAGAPRQAVRPQAPAAARAS